MPASIIDSKIFGDMFSDAAMRQVWSGLTKTEPPNTSTSNEHWPRCKANSA